MNQMIYKTVDGRDVTVDVFIPEETGDAARPAIAFFHGGGWAFGSPEEFHGACRRFAAKGFVTCSFQYRLCINEDGTYPNPDITPVECTKDARSALRWLRGHAAELGVDPDRIIAAGQSAGGQLAMACALLDDINEDNDDLSVSPMPNAILLYSSCVNTIEAWLENLMGERREEIWSISPYHNLRTGMPPVLQFHGKDDPMVRPYAVELFERHMLGLGNHHELAWIANCGHYLGRGCERYADYFDEAVMERTDEFLVELGLMP
jgi:acetyl esterase